MDITREDLTRLYGKKRTAELLFLLKDRQRYTQLAVDVAKELIQERGVGEEDWQELYAFQVVEQDERLRNARFREVGFWDKCFFYFGIPVVFFGMLLQNGILERYSEEGALVKISQLHLFFSMGLITAIICGLLVDRAGAYTSLAIWLAGFILANSIDSRASRKRREEYQRIYNAAYTDDL